MDVLLVGLGRWGEKHLRVLRELGVGLWVADVSPARLAWAVKRGGEPARAVADSRAALPRVAAVDVVTPADSHRAIAGACLAAGRHCFLEKPLTATAAEGRELAAAARAAARGPQGGPIFRFPPGPATRGAALQRDYLGRGLDDLSVTIVHYGEIPAVVEANYFAPGTFRDCVIVGERGALVADYGASTVSLHLGEHLKRGEAWEAVDTGKEELPARGEEPLRLELQAFLDACAGGRPCAGPAEAGVAALAVVEAAATSAREGRTITLAAAPDPRALIR